MEENKNTNLVYLSIVAIVAIVGIIVIFLHASQNSSNNAMPYRMMSNSPTSYKSMPSGIKTAMNSSKGDMVGSGASCSALGHHFWYYIGRMRSFGSHYPTDPDLQALYDSYYNAADSMLEQWEAGNCDLYHGPIDPSTLDNPNSDPFKG